MIKFNYFGVWYNKKELIIVLRHIADQIEKGIIEDDLIDWTIEGEDEKTGTDYVCCGVPMAEIQNCMIDGEQLEVYKCRICGGEGEYRWQ